MPAEDIISWDRLVFRMDTTEDSTLEDTVPKRPVGSYR